MKQASFDPKGMRRALVIKLRHHGDVLLSSPVFSVLKAQIPECEVDALVYSETAPMLEGHPAISQVLTIDRQWKSRPLFSQLRYEVERLLELRRRSYDLIVHLTEHWRGAWIARACRPLWAVAPTVRGRPRYWEDSFTHFVMEPRAGGRHMVERHLDFLRRLGMPVPLEGRDLLLKPGKQAEDEVRRLLKEAGLHEDKFVHIHPTSRWNFKCWPMGSMAQLVDRLHMAGWPVVITSSPDNHELESVRHLVGLLKSPVTLNLSGKLTLKELAALTGFARMFVGVDSAPMHIAAAMKTPVVALFGPSGESLWGPWGSPRKGQHFVVANNKFDCRPCGIDGCGGGKESECLTTLSVDRVFAACADSL